MNVRMTACLLALALTGCGASQIGNHAAVLPSPRVAYPVSAARMGEVFYVAAEALRCDKTTHKMYIYKDAPTFIKAANTANIAVRQNSLGFDIDLTSNTDMFIPIDKPDDMEEYVVTSITLPPTSKEENGTNTTK